MADLLFGDLGLIPVPKRTERQFRLRDDPSLTDFTYNELRSRYRFGRESIEFLVELLRDDSESETMPCQPLCKFLWRCAFLPVEAFSKLLEMLSACQSLSSHALSTTSPMPLHKNKYTSSSSHRLKQRLFKRNEAFMTREGSLG